MLKYAMPGAELEKLPVYAIEYCVHSLSHQPPVQCLNVSVRSIVII